MSRVPGYSRAGANGGYTNGNYGNSAGGYGGYGASDDPNAGRLNASASGDGDRRRRPGGYGGLSPAADDEFGQRPTNGRDRERRPSGYSGISSRDDGSSRRPSGSSIERDRDADRRGPGYGGYGGLSNREEDAPQVARPTSLERSQAKRRSGERRGATYEGQRIEQVLQHIQQKWDFMTKDHCVPIEVALKLMDSSSLGLANQANEFRQTHQDLQTALRGIVNGTEPLKLSLTPS